MAGAIFAIAFGFLFCIFYDCLLVDLVFVFIFFDNSLSNQEPILTFYFLYDRSLKVIIIIMDYGSIILYYSIL